MAKVWSNHSFTEILRDKVLFLNNDDTCWRHESVNHLSCSHEEADTRMFYHLFSIQSGNNVALRTNDTGCLIIELSTMENEDINVWIKGDVQLTNSQWFISLNQLYITSLGKTFCQSIPGYHEFTGCDYKASFCRRGKVRPLKILAKNVKLQQMFYDIDVSPIDCSI